MHADIYKYTPNNTDFTVFKQAGIPGLNFANIKGFNTYHNVLDNPKNLDRRSLQHHGSYTLALARHFGNLDLVHPSTANAVYFNIFQSTLVVYSEKLVIPFAILLVLGFGLVIVMGSRKKLLSWQGTGLGFLAFLLGMAAVGLIITLVIRLISYFYNQRLMDLLVNSQYGNFYLAGFVFLTVAIMGTCYIWFSKKITLPDFMVGMFWLWVIILVLTSLYFKGFSYLFTWPLLFGIACIGYLFNKAPQPVADKQYLILVSLSAVPAVVLFTPIIYLIYLSMTLGVAALLMVIAVLPLGIAIPYAYQVTVKKHWFLPGVSGIIALVLFLIGSLNYIFNR